MRIHPPLNYGPKNGRYKHGYTGTRTHRTWKAMRRRCSNSKGRAYLCYGQRGIKVCARWDDFLMFLEDMGEQPEGMGIDRINNDGDYEPTNCRWATLSQQARNTRRTCKVSYRGKTVPVADLADNVDIPEPTVLWRIKHGWSVEDALTILDGRYKHSRKIRGRPEYIRH